MKSGEGKETEDSKLKLRECDEIMLTKLELELELGPRTSEKHSVSL